MMQSPDTSAISSKSIINQRYYGFDLLKGISAFLIVGCHLKIKTTDAISTHLCFNEVGVALFAAISGFFLALSLEKETPKTVIWKRVSRLLPIHLFATIFYLAALSLFCYFLHSPSDYLDRMSLRFIVKSFLRGSAEVHLWFLPSLLYSSIAVVILHQFLSLIKRPRLNAHIYIDSRSRSVSGGL